MKVSNLLLDEEKAKQFFKLSVAFSAGCVITSVVCVRDFKKFVNRIKSRNEMVQIYQEKIRRIQKDVTLSGSEREEKIQTIIKFIDLIMSQPIK